MVSITLCTSLDNQLLMEEKLIKPKSKRPNSEKDKEWRLKNKEN